VTPITGVIFSKSPWIRKRFPEELLIALSLPQCSPGRRPLFAGVTRPKSSRPGIGDHTCSNKPVPDEQDDQGADDGTDEVRALVGMMSKLSRDMPGCVMSVLISSAPRALVDRCATRGRCGPPLDAPFPATLRPRRRMRRERAATAVDCDTGPEPDLQDFVVRLNIEQFDNLLCGVPVHASHDHSAQSSEDALGMDEPAHRECAQPGHEFDLRRNSYSRAPAPHRTYERVAYLSAGGFDACSS